MRGRRNREDSECSTVIGNRRALGSISSEGGEASRMAYNRRLKGSMASVMTDIFPDTSHSGSTVDGHRGSMFDVGARRASVMTGVAGKMSPSLPRSNSLDQGDSEGSEYTQSE